MRKTRKKFYPKSSTAMNHDMYLSIVVIMAFIAITFFSGLSVKGPEEVAATQPVIETAAPEAVNRVDRYTDIILTRIECRDLAAIIYLEARDQSAEGQQAVAEVVFNRVIADNFPDTVRDVIRQGAGTKRPQFSTISLLDKADPQQEQYDAILAALYGPSILDADVVYFSRGGENKRTWGTIGDHVFCYQYSWE